MNILETHNLSKFFDGLKALDGVSIEVPRQNIVLVIGPNGSGKSTLINVITGFHQADEGKVIFEGEDITNKPPHEIYRHGIVRTFQTPQPLKKLTVLENLLVAVPHPGESILRSLGRGWVSYEEEYVEKAYEILEFLGIDHLWHQESYKLSGGQLKLVEIGRALMGEAKLIVMDEPIAGVAPALSHSILDKLTKLKEMGVTFLIVEHRLDIILKYVDYIYVMANGKIIAEGREEEILKNPEVIEVYLGAAHGEAECGV
ncbi:ABC transporter ATP-binding protein [Archaeoglobus veneficus]|uniref:Probable branched-chain amino acid transport ATP-binding protein LivG n=1 Tax=Archaeoglobus veneficus (strain DSM 11195 / SNP6) TaxID=693661 RepID=F2KRZ3_ARCVS|nr:ABC transporter ATP-binding protein [Archaeoglobus veneficus]AEA46834.1 Phosphonate-transporting ATPase [Archaeoglobus veneficus SNP6]